MLRDFIDQYQENRITATKWESPTSKFRSFINSFLIDMLVFIAAILTVFIIFASLSKDQTQIVDQHIQMSQWQGSSIFIKSAHPKYHQQTGSKVLRRVQEVNNPKSQE